MPKKTRKQRKKLAGECFFCENKNYAVLHIHRITPGSKYFDWGELVVCSNCHNRIHNNQLIILGKFRSTHRRGWILIYKENGEEKIK